MSFPRSLPRLRCLLRFPIAIAGKTYTHPQIRCRHAAGARPPKWRAVGAVPGQAGPQSVGSCALRASFFAHPMSVCPGPPKSYPTGHRSADPVTGCRARPNPRPPKPKLGLHVTHIAAQARLARIPPPKHPSIAAKQERLMSYHESDVYRIGAARDYKHSGRT